MKIIFQKLKYKNILSVGNAFVEIELDKARTTLFVGENGSGKSTLLDALCFGLFGKPFRKANKPTLVNSINGRDLVVEIEFLVNNKPYKIRRGIKPNIFEIYANDVLINQNSSNIDYQRFLEKNILKLNYKSFTQLVILGSSTYVAFMVLPASVRREIIEDLLDIRAFSTMNILLRDRLAEVNTRIERVDDDIRVVRNQCEFKENHVQVVEENLNQRVEKLDSDIVSAQSLLGQKETELDECEENITSLEKKLADRIKFENKKENKTRLRQKVSMKLEEVNKAILFFEENDICPTCNQDIDRSFKKSVLCDKNETKKQLQEFYERDEVALRKLRNVLSQFDKLSDRLSVFRAEKARLSGEISAQRKYISELKRQREERNKDYDVAADKEEIERLRTEIEDLTEEKEKLIEKREIYRTCSSLLKDGGIKSAIIAKYVPVINSYINKYLQAMNFPVCFELNEYFDEKIRSRYRDTFSYANFSEGERQRINLALIFTWRAVAQLKNSINTNLLVMDEVFDSSMDAEGVESLLDILATEELLNSCNVFIMSHREVNLDKFDRAIQVTKKGNFSVMRELE